MIVFQLVGQALSDDGLRPTCRILRGLEDCRQRSDFSGHRLGQNSTQAAVLMMLYSRGRNFSSQGLIRAANWTLGSSLRHRMRPIWKITKTDGHQKSDKTVSGSLKAGRSVSAMCAAEMIYRTGEYWACSGRKKQRQTVKVNAVILVLTPVIVTLFSMNPYLRD